jgi:Raf kinase inhibitor-like YbhB/YbcL family protein
MKITSNDFGPGGKIPSEFTCDGKGVIPNIVISEIPEISQSMVLIVEDPDAPSGIFTHYLLIDIPVSGETVECDQVVGNSIEGLSLSGRAGWVPPCPPDGTHRYFFKIYALSKMLQLDQGASRKEVEEAMKGMVIAEAELMGTYSREDH